MAHNIIIFSDFDGTIARRDVGNRLFHHFSGGRSEGPVARWRAGELDSQECLKQEADVIRDLTAREFFEFVEGFELDSTFGEFVSLLQEHHIPLYILSDGLDLYIQHLLQKNGLDGLTVFANRARFDNGRLKVDWPYAAHSCGKCGNCKGYHIRRLTSTRQKAIYIGDGQSDLCAVPAADIIFAKGYLADYCREERIDFIPFRDFSSVTNTIKTRFVLKHDNRV